MAKTMELPEYHPYWHEMKNPESGIVTTWRCIGRNFINGKPANYTYEFVCDKHILDGISMPEIRQTPLAPDLRHTSEGEQNPTNGASR